MVKVPKARGSPLLRFFNFHIPHYLPLLCSSLSGKFLKDSLVSQGNTDMLDNLMDFSPRDKNKLIFSSSTHHGSLRIYKWVPFQQGESKKGTRRIEKENKTEILLFCKPCPISVQIQKHLFIQILRSKNLMFENHEFCEK